MKKLNYLLLTICLIVGFTSCKQEKKELKQANVEFKKEGELTLYKSTSDSIITKLDIEIADTDYDVQTGLMYRDSMKDNQAMLFVFPTSTLRSFYMKNTKIPLDIIFLDGQKQIVSFKENAVPFDENGLKSEVPAQFVLEINAGLAEKWLLEVGDRLDYYEIR